MCVKASTTLQQTHVVFGGLTYYDSEPFIWSLYRRYYCGKGGCFLILLSCSYTWYVPFDYVTDTGYVAPQKLMVNQTG